MHQPLLMPEEMEAAPKPKSFREKFDDFRTLSWNTYQSKPFSHWLLLTLSTLAMLVAFPASSLLSRVYYSNGGNSKWIISWVAVVGWPIPAIVLIPTYLILKIYPSPPSLKLFLSYVVLGFFSAADNLMYAYGYAYMPASTASLLGSTSLIFSSLFGYLLVKNKINASTVNAIVIITAAMVIIALDSSSDLYGNVTKTQYYMGFLWNILGSALHGLIFALSELVFIKLMGRISFHVVLEQQVMVSFFGFLFTTIGVVINDDFKTMASEAKSFEGGKSSYLSVLVWGVITFQTENHTGIPFLDHMLDQLASHGLFDVHVKATGDIHIDDHHTNEDVALAIGTALLQALGDRKGINRFGDFSAPLDEALVHVSLDLSGRPHLSYDLKIPTERVGTYDTQLVEHFFQSLVNTSGMTLHIRQLAGKNSHHIIEATFKAFARALRQATEYDPRRRGSVPSSKGVLSRS